MLIPVRCTRKMKIFLYKYFIICTILAVFCMWLISEYYFTKAISTNELDEQCVCARLQRQKRIAGGYSAQLNQFPSFVMLYSAKATPLCGGTLITRNYVLTAGHCVFSHLLTNNLSVVAGQHSLMNVTNSSHISVDKIILHEDFDSATYKNDIAILKLDRPMNLSSSILPACFPSADINLTEINVTVAGWGMTDKDSEPISKTLQVANLPVISSDQCKAIFYNEKLFLPNIGTAVFCTLDQDNHKRTCQGDSGSPAYFPCNGLNILLGVVSGGLGCVRSNIPSVFSNVMHYNDWISKSINTKMCVHNCLS